MDHKIKHLINLYNKGSFNDLINEAKRFVKEDNKNFIIWNILGAAYKILNDLNHAHKAFEKSIEIEPKFSDPYNNLGIIFFEQGKLIKALELFETAIKLKPNYIDAYSNMGLVLKDMSLFDKALKTLKKGLTFDNKNKQIFFNIGIVYQEIKDLENAEIFFNQAIELDPKNVDYIYRLSNLMLSTKRYDEALILLKRIIQIGTNTTNINKVNFWIKALEGKNAETAPIKHIQDIFDKYAKNFDESLVDDLQYNVPKLIFDKLLEIKKDKNFGNVVDFGCGTGLVGEKIKDYCSLLIGVDISKKMLFEAKKKNIYNKLLNIDIITFLENEKLNYNLFIFADVFIYVGELNEIFQLIKSKIKISGSLVFTIELNENKDYFLEKSGRFSHSQKYIEKLASMNSFKISHFQQIKLRKEFEEFIKGALVIIDF